MDETIGLSLGQIKPTPQIKAIPIGALFWGFDRASSSSPNSNLEGAFGNLMQVPPNSAFAQAFDQQ